jgi:TetR/AcrR family acrAB operon transcriptional repressor
VTESVLSVNSSPGRDPRPGREARLLDAAAALFARYGFDKTSVDDIARAAGVSKGAVYLHWPSKVALFDATLLREGLRLLEDLRARVEADPAGGTLASIYRHSLVAMGSNPLLLAVYTLDARVLGDYVHRQDPAIYARRMIFGEEFVRRMQAAHLMRSDLDPATAAYLMGVISFGLLSIRQHAPNVPAPSLETLAVALADLVQRGLATDDTRAAEAGKAAFGTLVDDTIRLYTHPPETAPGHGSEPHHHHHTSSAIDPHPAG